MDIQRASVNDIAQACARSADAAEWDELMRRCIPLVSLVVLRVARLWMTVSSPALVDDIVQEVFLKLCEQDRRILKEFQPRGEDSFMGLLRIVASSVANDHFRRLHSIKRGGKVVTGSLSDDSVCDTEVTQRGSQEMQRAVLLAQLDNRLRSAPQSFGERDRTIFWLYYEQGFTAEEIARFHDTGLSSKGVESALRRVTQWVRAEIVRRPGEVTPSSEDTKFAL